MGPDTHTQGFVPAPDSLPAAEQRGYRQQLRLLPGQEDTEGKS